MMSLKIVLKKSRAEGHSARWTVLIGRLPRRCDCELSEDQAGKLALEIENVAGQQSTAGLVFVFAICRPSRGLAA